MRWKSMLPLVFTYMVSQVFLGNNQIFSASGIYLCGHSAGAHLAALMLMTSFSEYDAFDSDLIKGENLC